MQEDIRNISEFNEEDADSAAEAAGHTRPPVPKDATDYAKAPRPSLDPERKMSWAVHSVRSMQEDIRNISGELSEENEEDTDIDAEEAGNTPAPATESPPQGKGKAKANWNFVKGEIKKEAMKSLKDENYENARRISLAMKSIKSMQEDIKNMDELSEEDADSGSEEEDTDSDAEEDSDADAEEACDTAPPGADDKISSAMSSLRSMEEDIQHLSELNEEDTGTATEEAGPTPTPSPATTDAAPKRAMLVALESIEDIIEITDIGEEIHAKDADRDAAAADTAAPPAAASPTPGKGGASWDFVRKEHKKTSLVKKFLKSSSNISVRSMQAGITDIQDCAADGDNPDPDSQASGKRSIKAMHSLRHMQNSIRSINDVKSSEMNQNWANDSIVTKQQSIQQMFDNLSDDSDESDEEDGDTPKREKKVSVIPEEDKDHDTTEKTDTPTMEKKPSLPQQKEQPTTLLQQFLYVVFLSGSLLVFLVCRFFSGALSLVGLSAPDFLRQSAGNALSEDAARANNVRSGEERMDNPQLGKKVN